MKAGDEFPHRRSPCAECPWRVDTPPGQFDAERYRALRCTSGEPGREAPLGAPFFACHKSPPGGELACAGWLAVAGYDHLGIRLAVVQGRLDPSALESGTDWPPLHATYEEMATTKAALPERLT